MCAHQLTSNVAPARAVVFTLVLNPGTCHLHKPSLDYCEKFAHVEKLVVPIAQQKKARNSLTVEYASQQSIDKLDVVACWVPWVTEGSWGSFFPSFTS